MPFYKNANLVSIGGASGDTPSYYRAISRVTQPIPTTAGGAVIQFEVEKESKEITYSNGELFINVPGEYVGLVDISLDVGAGFINAIETWVEASNDGIVWNPSPDSGQVFDFDAFNEGHVTYSASFAEASPRYLRLKIRSTAGAPTLGTSTLANGVVQPSARISLSRVSSV